MKRLILFVFGIVLFAPAAIQAQGVTISQFQKATYSDLLIDSSGTYHAVFLESPAIGKPRFVYYSTSSNGGRGWSKPVTISNDGTGNGSSAPRLIQDRSGTIYAIWKRWGTKESRYPVPDTILEGTGGSSIGTLFFVTLGGAAPGEPVMIGEREETVISWFPTLDQNGAVTIVWSQVSEESAKNNWRSSLYADWIRAARLSGGSVGQIASLTNPAPPPYKGGAPPANGVNNLHGYITPSGSLRFIAERVIDKSQTIIYWDGRGFKSVYAYPKFTTFNNFNNPARLLYDENGKDHIVFEPAASTLESEQIWSVEAATGKRTVLVSLQDDGVEIEGMQAYQGPGGRMTVAFQAGKLSEANEGFLCAYTAGVWKIYGITKNAAKGSFSYREFPFNGSYIPVLGALKRYDTTFIAIAHDREGNRKALMTVSEYFSTGAFSTSSPSVIYIGGAEGRAAAPERPASPAGNPRRRGN